MSQWARLERIWNTVKYMTARQWIYRCFYTLKKRFPAQKLCVPRSVSVNAEIFSLFNTTPLNPDNNAAKSIEIAKRIRSHRFDVLPGHGLRFEKKIDWDLKGETYRLVIFRLNSFSWLEHLTAAFRATGDKSYAKEGFLLIRDWMSKSDAVTRLDKWNPYVIAQRLMAWLAFFSVCGECEADLTPFWAWMYAQAKILSHNVEFQLGANHVLSEARALLFMGAAFGDEKLYAQGKRILSQELCRQFLSDGGHYERSVSYHVESLQQYFEANILMTLLHDEDVGRFTAGLVRPFAFLNAMIDASGLIPLVNDAAVDYPFDARDFLSVSGLLFASAAPCSLEGPYFRQWSVSGRRRFASDWNTDAFFPETGFLMRRFYVGGKQYSLFFDAGNNGPDENPAHAHADALSVLLSSEDGPLLVDSGAFTYCPGAQRDLCRRTAAHNTIEIDGKNSAEIWSAFRVARRGHVRLEDYRNAENAMRITASHDGYRACLDSPVIHTRTIELADGALTITDFLQGKEKVPHNAVLRWHLSPDCLVHLTGEREVEINGALRLTCTQSLALEPCDIAFQFGLLRQSVCVTARLEFQGNAELETRIVFPT